MRPWCIRIGSCPRQEQRAPSCRQVYSVLSMSAHVFVDYHNLPRGLRDAGLSSVARSIDQLVHTHTPAVEEIYIRLYGGWYDENGLSNDGTRLTQELGRDFPITLSGTARSIRRIYCEIASSLVASRSDLFPATLRKSHGLDWFIRGPHPTGCIDPVNCTIPTVLKWSRRGCPTPGCPVTHFEAFTCNQQKLVDTLLCCDLLSVAGPDNELFLVSEDDDLIPALVLAGVRSTKVWHVRSKPNKVRLYDSMLLSRGVQLVAL